MQCELKPSRHSAVGGTKTQDMCATFKKMRKSQAKWLIDRAALCYCELQLMEHATNITTLFRYQQFMLQQKEDEDARRTSYNSVARIHLSTTRH